MPIDTRNSMAPGTITTHIRDRRTREVIKETKITTPLNVMTTGRTRTKNELIIFEIYIKKKVKWIKSLQ